MKEKPLKTPIFLISNYLFLKELFFFLFKLLLIKNRLNKLSIKSFLKMILGYWIDVKKCKSFIKDYYALDRHPTSLEIWISIFIDNFFHSIIAGFSKGFNIWYFSLYDGIGYFETFRFNFFFNNNNICYFFFLWHVLHPMFFSK